MSDLHEAIAAWRRSLQVEGLSDERIAELEDHLHCSLQSALDAGASPEQAFATAAARMGEPSALAEEFHAMNLMHPLSKLLGLAIAIATMFGVLEIEGGHSIVLFALPPLWMVLGISLGGLVASHGLQRVLRVFAVALGCRRADSDEVGDLQSVCRRGHRLAHAAGVLQAIFGVIGVCSHLDHPGLIGPHIAYCLIGLVHAVVVAELGFATMERWVGRPLRIQPAT